MKLPIIIALLSLVAIAAPAQVPVDKALAQASIDALIPAQIKSAQSQVAAAQADESGAIVLDGVTLKLVRAGANKLGRGDELEAAEAAKKSAEAEAEVMGAFAAGEVGKMPEALREKFKALSPIEKQVILDFFKPEK